MPYKLLFSFYFFDCLDTKRKCWVYANEKAKNIPYPITFKSKLKQALTQNERISTNMEIRLKERLERDPQSMYLIWEQVDSDPYHITIEGYRTWKDTVLCEFCEKKRVDGQTTCKYHEDEAECL